MIPALYRNKVSYLIGETYPFEIRPIDPMPLGKSLIHKLPIAYPMLKIPISRYS